MKSLIINRDFQHPADGWYQIEPKGDHAHPSANLVQVIDDEAGAAIVNRFNADAARPNFPGMLIDHEHFKHDQDKETRAYGWLMKLANRTDGIYGQVRWSNVGKAAVDGGEYRFFSTEYDPSDLRVLNSAKVKRVRPLRLDGLTLTNDPNNRGGKPITNRSQDFRHGDVPAADSKNQNQRKQMKSVCSLLGLSADASEEAAHAEVTKLLNRATGAEAKVTPLTERVTELETLNGTLVDDQIAADLDARGIKEEKVVNRLKPVLKGLKNRAERIATLDDFGFKAADPKDTTAGKQTKLFNRDTKPPGAKASEESNGLPDAAAATKIMNRARQIEKDTKVSAATAVMMAQREIGAETAK